MAEPRVSVVITNYNYARYLPAAIDSALAQTHPGVEVVVVDDGSRDASPEVIRGYGDRVVPVCKANGGQGSAFNAGLGAATGDVVLFLDADDLLAPDAVARVLDVWRAHPDTAVVMFRLRVVDGEGRDTGRVRPRRPGVMPDGDLRRHVARYRCYHWQPTSGNAFSRAALTAVLPVPEEEYRISADAYVAGLVPLCGPVRSIDDVGGSYRLHGESNYSSSVVDAAYFREQIARIVATHGHAVRLGAQLGRPLPPDPRTALDTAFLAFRLASLLLEPGRHPYPDDRRAPLVRRGLLASLGNRQLTWPTRARRAGWFLACGLLPRPRARRVVETATPDTPASRRTGRRAQ